MRTNLSAVLREVQAGATLRVTVRGRPVAELLPLLAKKEHLSPGDVERIVREAPLAAGFAAALEQVAGATMDEL